MPLTNCPDCNHQVSTEALACPSCGAPISGKPSKLQFKRALFITLFGWIFFLVVGIATGSAETVVLSIVAIMVSGFMLRRMMK
jgi:hypothetical protein